MVLPIICHPLSYDPTALLSKLQMSGNTLIAGELRKPKDPVMQHGKLERIADFSQQQLGSMENVCNAFLAQVASINSQLVEKAAMVSNLQKAV